MKTVFLLRHAKSSRSDSSLADHERPLAGRGRRAADAMGRFMRREGLVPDVVLCSTAVRARQTWRRVAEGLDLEEEVAEYRDDLYAASPGDLLEALRRVPEKGAGSVLLVGHNPGMEELAGRLSGSGEPAARERMARKYPSGALAVLRSDADRWEALSPECCSLDRFVRPKDLPEADDMDL